MGVWRQVAIAMLAVLPCVTTGCGGYTVVQTSDRTVASREAAVESRTTWSVSGVAIVDERLALRLERECAEVVEITETRVRDEHREYETTALWWTSAGVWVGTMAIAMTLIGVGHGAENDDCPIEDEIEGRCGDEGEGYRTAGAAISAVGNTAAVGVAGTAAYYEWFAEDLVETPLGEDTRRRVDPAACSAPWPHGEARLMTSDATQTFVGEIAGSARVEVEVAGAPREVWLSDSPMQLALPETLDWIEVELPADVRRALLDQEATTDPRRVYVWGTPPGGDHDDLMRAGVVRVQSALTATRRYQLPGDETTLELIDAIVERGGGRAERLRDDAVEAARAREVERVLQITMTPLFETQVQVSLTAFDTATGDAVYMADAPADLADPVAALDVFGELAAGFAEWDRP